MKRRYRRYFVMLELQDKNYKAYQDKEVKGHGKIEIKNGHGTLSIHCQNLKGGDSNRYRWYLINTNKEGEPVIVEVGPMEIDERGRGQIVCQFNAANVKGSLEEIENFNLLVLVVQNKEGQRQLHTPLVGYMDKDRPQAASWKYPLANYLHMPVGAEASQKPLSIELVEEERPLSIGLVEEERPLSIGLVEGGPEARDGLEDRQEDLDQLQAREEGQIPGAGLERSEDKVEGGEGLETEPEDGPGSGPRARIRVRFKEQMKAIEEEALDQLEGGLGDIVEEIKEDLDKEIREDPDGENRQDPGKESKREASREAGDIKVKASQDMGEGDEEEVREETSKGTGAGIEIEPKEEAKDQAEDYAEQMQAYIENSLKGFVKVEPFGQDLDHYIWWQIPYNAQTMYRAYMPFILYLDSLKEPTSYYISKILQIIYVHKHHIFGICYDPEGRAKHYAYGIPGHNQPLEASLAVDIELSRWYPAINGLDNGEVQGYSILSIDAKKGELRY